MEGWGFAIEWWVDSFGCLRFYDFCCVSDSGLYLEHLIILGDEFCKQIKDRILHGSNFWKRTMSNGASKV